MNTETNNPQFDKLIECMLSNPNIQDNSRVDGWPGKNWIQSVVEVPYNYYPTQHEQEMLIQYLKDNCEYYEKGITGQCKQPIKISRDALKKVSFPYTISDKKVGFHDAKKGPPDAVYIIRCTHSECDTVNANISRNRVYLHARKMYAN